MYVDSNLVTLQERYIINDSLYILRLFPKIFSFKAGQHVSISLPGDTSKRVYSIASGEDDNFYDLLIREIEEGKLSPKFKTVDKNSVLKISKPKGSFILPHNFRDYSIYCIATGSGIAPFLSFSKTHPDFPFTIIHGIKSTSDSFIKDFSSSISYVTCSSKVPNAMFNGRVTDYIQMQNLSSKSLFFLCGNDEMINQINSYLLNIGFEKNVIFFEEYYKK